MVAVGETLQKNEKIIPGYSKYTVTDDGMIYSWRRGERNLINQIENSAGYLFCNVLPDNEKIPRQRYVHRLVAATFLENPEGKKFVNHLDGCPKNNDLSNLEYATASENSIHAVRTGLFVKQGREVYKLDLKGIMVEKYPTMTAASKACGIPVANIVKVCKGERKLAGNARWCYATDYTGEETKIAPRATCIPVQKLNEDGEVIAEYDGLTQAAADNNTNTGMISAACRGLCETAGGSRWRYKPIEETPEDVKEEPTLYDQLGVKNWGIHPNFPEYCISRDGRIFSMYVKRIINQKIAGSYWTITLMNKNDNPQTVKVHRLLADLYVINPDPKTKTQVNHKNSNRLDNSIENLEFVSPSENTLHAFKSGNLKPPGRKRVRQIDRKGKVIAEFDSIAAAKRATGIDTKTLSHACRDDKFVRGYYWKFIAPEDSDQAGSF